MPVDRSAAPTSIADLLRTGPLARLAAKVEAREILAESLRARLPDDVAAHLVASSLDDGVLTVVMDAPVWAARIRYMGSRLVDHTRLFVKVVPVGGVVGPLGAPKIRQLSYMA